MGGRPSGGAACEPGWAAREGRLPSQLPDADGRYGGGLDADGRPDPRDEEAVREGGRIGVEVPVFP